MEERKKGRKEERMNKLRKKIRKEEWKKGEGMHKGRKVER